MIKVSLYNEKPRVGKTSLTIQIANLIKRRFNKNVAIVDCSDEQLLYKKRKEELKRFYRPSTTKYNSNS